MLANKIICLLLNRIVSNQKCPISHGFKTQNHICKADANDVSVSHELFTPPDWVFDAIVLFASFGMSSKYLNCCSVSGSKFKTNAGQGTHHKFYQYFFVST